MALISFSRDAGDASNALAYARQLEQMSPDPQLTRLIEELQQRAHEARCVQPQALSRAWRPRAPNVVRLSIRETASVVSATPTT